MERADLSAPVNTGILTASLLTRLPTASVAIRAMRTTFLATAIARRRVRAPRPERPCSAAVHRRRITLLAVCRAATGVALAPSKKEFHLEIIQFLIDFILHVDKHLEAFVVSYGPWVYALLFAIVFIETGLVVMPFLPGDSLLFIVGALCGAGLMNFPLAVGLLMVAAVLGDQCNYTIGRYFGPKVFQWDNSRWFNRRAFDQAHGFYERYGGITIVLARFMPFIRTFAPFVAGVAAMGRGKFTAYNVGGAVLWVMGICTAGYFFGNFAWVKLHLDKIIWALILVPGLIAIFGAWRASKKSAPPKVPRVPPRTALPATPPITAPAPVPICVLVGLEEHAPRLNAAAQLVAIKMCRIFMALPFQCPLERSARAPSAAATDRGFHYGRSGATCV